MVVENDNTNHDSHTEHESFFTGEPTSVFSEKEKEKQSLLLLRPDFILKSLAQQHKGKEQCCHCQRNQPE